MYMEIWGTSSFQTMAQDDPLTHRLTSVAQASTSGRCKADPARLKEDPTSAMKIKFGVDIGNSTLYQKPYPPEFDLVSFPAGWCVPDFVKFSGDDNKAPWEHIDQYILQLGKAGFHEALRICLFSLSLTKTAFSWFSSFAPNSIQSWNQLETWNVSFMIVFIMGTMMLNCRICHWLGKAKMSLLRITSEGLKI